MIHQISTTPIYFSKDYKLFKFITGNRSINETKVKKIIKDIDDGLNMLKYCPIVVTRDLKIIDGQHRFQVSKILKCPVYFVIAEDISLRDIAAINSRTERWKPIDFVRCYVENGNKQYVIIEKFVKTYNMPVSSALMLLYNGYSENNYSQRALREFEAGTYVVKHQDEVKVVADYAMLFEGFSNTMAASFLKALAQLFRVGKFDKDVLVAKYMANPEALTSLGSYKAYLSKLEEIYNYRNQKRIAIY